MTLKELCKKLGLDSGKIETEFGLSEDDSTIGGIAHKIAEKTGRYGEFIEGFLNPDHASYAALSEVHVLDMEKVNEVFIALNLINRQYLLADLKGTEESFQQFIKLSLEEWEGIKPLLTAIIEQVKNSWKESLRGKEELGYLG
ncbi:MAG: hypothetical protein Q7S65_06400 [Nanoarchaeota archaeon]|nr:hypothetical protein [Nanoarchaeota archaeon]